MTVIGIEPQPPVNQCQTGHYKASCLHLSSRWHKTQSDVSSGQRSPSRLDSFSVKLFLLYSFLYSSFSQPLPFPCIPSLFCDDLIPAVCSLPLYPSIDSFLYPHPTPSSLSQMKSECSSSINSHCRPSIVISLHRTAGETVLTNFITILPYPPASPFLDTSGSSKQLRGQLSKQDAS